MVQARAAKFQIRRQMLDAEGHLGRLGGDAEFAEEPREIGVGDFVEDHEAGVNRHGTVRFSD